MDWTSIEVATPARQAFVDITAQVQRLLEGSEVEEGLLTLFCTHTTAGLMINENADPHVLTDLELTLSTLVPPRDDYRHAEGNSDAHAKSALVGATLQVPLVRGRLHLGRWQGIFLCEFDGPRRRRVLGRVSR